MRLVKPTKIYEESWRQALAEFEAEGCSGFWNIPEKPTDINEYIERTKNHEKGIDIPEDWVSATTFWLIDEDRFVGHVNIRHELNQQLEKIGGNVGYYIRPTERGKGYGKKILELALVEAKKLGLESVLITCDVDNLFSQKVVEYNGGRFLDDIDVEGRKIRRYRIVL